MKYIRMRRLDNNEEEIFVFPVTVNHDCMADALGRLRNRMRGNWERIPRHPVSAGFVDVQGNCHGISESLGLDSLGEADTELLRQQG